MPTTRPIIENVRNVAPSASCTNYSGGAQPLFTYYTVDRGTGAQTPVSISGVFVNSLVDISFVQITAIVDITPGQSPTCQNIRTSVSLRNWRGS